MKGAYTYSRAINMTDDDGWAGLSWNDPTILRRNRAQAGYNTPQVFQMSYVYELPFGKGKTWATSGVPAKILGGWQTSGIFSAISGQPFSLSDDGALLNAVGQSQTPNQTGPVTKIGGIGPGQKYYDPSSFTTVKTDKTYGNVGRNPLLGPGSVNMDFSLFRTINLTERFNLQFRTDAANLFNTPHFWMPVTGMASVQFGQITSSQVTVLPRVMQFALKLQF